MNEEQKDEIKEDEIKEKTVVVKKRALDKILDDIERLKKDNEMLLGIADKSRLAFWEEKIQKPQIHIVKLSTWEVNGKPKVILAWRSVKDEMYQDANGTWHEDQKTEIILEDKTKLVIQSREFWLKPTKIPAQIIQRSVDEVTGNTTLKVETKDEKIYEIDQRFVN